MEPDAARVRQVLDREERAWHELEPPAYDDRAAHLLDEVGDAAGASANAGALLPLAGATLQRNDSSLTESRAHAAEQLIALAAVATDPCDRLRIRLLLVIAWIQLTATVVAGPENIERTAPLPAGVQLPSGADPEQIRDPVLREQAREAVTVHRGKLARWSSKQRAIGHLNRLATMISGSPAFAGSADGNPELAAAMRATAPLLPDVQLRS